MIVMVLSAYSTPTSPPSSYVLATSSSSSSTSGECNYCLKLVLRNTDYYSKYF